MSRSCHTTTSTPYHSSCTFFMLSWMNGLIDNTQFHLTFSSYKNRNKQIYWQLICRISPHRLCLLLFYVFFIKLSVPAKSERSSPDAQAEGEVTSCSCSVNDQISWNRIQINWNRSQLSICLSTFVCRWLPSIELKYYYRISYVKNVWKYRQIWCWDAIVQMRNARRIRYFHMPCAIA